MDQTFLCLLCIDPGRVVCGRWYVLVGFTPPVFLSAILHNYHLGQENITGIRVPLLCEYVKHIP